ncbi:MAG: extracellular solute-binding protein [Blastochloris sp.]|nr:extracellular solute-binding protein [Blastochloris sp.]
MQKKALLIVLLMVAMSAMTLAPAAAQEVVTIQYWDYWLTQGPAIDRGIEEFEAMHPNINIEKTTQAGGGYPELVNAAFQGGPDSTPDVFVLPDSSRLPQYLASGWLRAWNDLAGFEEFRATFPDPDFNFLEGTNTIEGLTYSAPFSLPNDAVWVFMYINTDVYEQAGLTEEDYPETLDQLIENSRIIAENTDAYSVGFSGTQGWAAGWWMWMCQRSAQFFSVAPFPGFDHTTATFNTAENACANAALEGLVTLRDEGLVHPQTAALAVDDEGVRVLFAQNEFAHLIAGNWVIAGWEQTNPDFSSYDVIPLPLAGVEEPGGAFTSGPGGNWFAIASDTEHPEEAFEWIKYLYSAEFGAIWAEEGNGLTIMTPQPYDQYADRPAWEAIYSFPDMVVPGPSVGLRNPATAEVVMTLQGRRWTTSCSACSAARSRIFPQRWPTTISAPRPRLIQALPTHRRQGWMCRLKIISSRTGRPAQPTNTTSVVSKRAPA